MTNLNFIAAGIIIIAVTAIIGIRIYKNSKNGISYNLDQFVDEFGDNIIEMLKDIISILKVNMDMYETQDDYEMAVISMTIESMKENAEDFGMPKNIANLFDTEALAKVIKDIFIDNRCDIMSVLDAATIMANTAIMDKEVVEVIGTEAIEE